MQKTRYLDLKLSSFAIWTPVSLCKKFKDKLVNEGYNPFRFHCWSRFHLKGEGPHLSYKCFAVELKTLKRFQHLLIPVIVFLGILTLANSPGTRSADSAKPVSWKNLEKGLDLGIFQAPKKSALGDSLIRILRADTHYFDLRLLNASSKDQGKRRSVKDWVNKNGLVAAINASM